MAFSQEVIDAAVAAADVEQIPRAALLAVIEVESAGKAFKTVNGRPMPLILYEYHVFYRYDGLSDAERAEAVTRKLAARRWGDLPYKSTMEARYNQLEKAAEINEQAAFAACSWGVGQVLGENADWLGLGSPKALAEMAMSGIAGQIEVMMAFIRKRGLVPTLQALDWRAFARKYNGSGQVDYYSTRMASAYARLNNATPAGGANPQQPLENTMLRAGSKGEDVATLQRRLRGLGYHLEVDADFGPATERQVKLFQADNGLSVDGIAGPLTLARIEAMSAG